MSVTSVETPSVEVTADLISNLINRGGYTHPLFNPTAAEHSTGTEAPLPGQGVLLLAGGLVEQSGALNDAIALVELKSVRFLKMVKAGATLRVELTPGSSHKTTSGKVLREYNWVVLNGAREHILEATAVMLMHTKTRK